MSSFKINKEEFDLFLTVASALNREGVVPLLFGSLGLMRIVGEFKKVSDVDLFLPRETIERNKERIYSLMSALNFFPADKDLEFKKNDIVIEIAGFHESDERLREFMQLKILEGVYFYELPLSEYLKFYKKAINQKNREKEKEDQKKIEIIEDYIERDI